MQESSKRFVLSRRDHLPHIHRSDDALDLLKTISTIAPGHVSQNTLPLLFSLLPDEAPAREDATGREKYWNVLSSLSRLCEQAVLFETLVVRLSTKLDLLCSPNPSASRRDPEPTAAYAHSILNTLSGVLEKKVERGDADVPKYIDRLVLPLLNLFIGGAASKDDPSDLPVTDFRLILLVANTVNLVMQTLSAEYVLHSRLAPVNLTSTTESRRPSSANWSLCISKVTSRQLL